MILKNCNSCVHKLVCKHTEWVNSESEKQIDFSEYTSRGFRAEVVVECMNFHSEAPVTVVPTKQTVLPIPDRRPVAKKRVEKKECKTINEAAIMLGLGYTDVRKLIIDGKLRAKKNVLIGNRWEIPIEEIEQYQSSIA
jgi:excisionase family DNA binding protein